MASPISLTDPADDPSAADLLAARPWLKRDAIAGLLMEQVPLAGIADAVGTPTWVYTAATMRGRYRRLASAMADAGLALDLHYAVKANDSLAVLSLFNREAAGADVVSGGELRKVLHVGFPASKVVYSGLGQA